MTKNNITVLRRMLPIFFKIIGYAFIVFIGCNQTVVQTSENRVAVTIVDVGQGLSQIITVGDSAYIVDMGPPNCKETWEEAYRALGMPPVAAIIISHRDLDHSGGLSFFSDENEWTGTIITSYLEDTLFMRAQCGLWDGALHFVGIAQGDTVLSNGNCSITCLWPPKHYKSEVPVPAEETNSVSLVLLVRNHATSLLLTADIDSLAEQSLSETYAASLNADLIVVPHHGSSSALNSLFYGYVRPKIAVISSGKNNSYGHPSPETGTLLGTLGILSKNTTISGTLTWISNGFYWTQLF